MKNKLFYSGGILLIICSLTLSYFTSEWYGERVIGTTFPINEGHYLPPIHRDTEEIKIEDVLYVFNNGSTTVKVPISLYELETFAFTKNVIEQLEVLRKEQSLSVIKRPEIFGVTLERYSLNGFADVYVWKFDLWQTIFLNDEARDMIANSHPPLVEKVEDELLVVYYHDISNQILKIQSKGEEIYLN